MKAVLVTIGTLGDLHPFIAIGQALVRRGVAVTLAVPLDHVAKVRAAGLDAAAILPSFAAICAARGLSEAEAARRVLRERAFVLDAVIMPALASSTAALDAAAEGADVIVGSLFALAAGIVAEKRGLPLVAVALQPMALMSASDPPHGPGFGAMRHAGARHRVGPIARRWNRACYAAGRAMLRRRYGGGLAAVRRDQGLAPTAAVPLIDPVPAQVATLCAYSPLFAPLPPDAPPRAVATGFPRFDSEDGRTATLHPALVRFLDAGPPPLVFTLGSFVTSTPGRFYDEAAAAARASGRRAVLLDGGDGPPREAQDRLTLGYAPHAPLFARAAAIVHHGGIGTTGQALHAGKPQLVVPHFGDQFDNAGHVVRLGVGGRIAPAAFRGRAAERAIGQIADDPQIRRTAATIGTRIADEQGADRAAEAVIAIVCESHG